MAPIIVTILLNAIAFTVLFLVVTRRIRRELSGEEVLSAIRDEVQSLIVELNQTTDRNVSLTEERMNRLQTLLREADRKIQLLDREIEKHQVGVDVYERLKSQARTSVGREGAQSLPSYEKASGGPGDLDRPIDPTVVPAGGGQPPSGDAAPPRSISRPDDTNGSNGVGNRLPLAERVVQLSQQGFDSRVIAQRLKTTLGEVELILSLRSGRMD